MNLQLTNVLWTHTHTHTNTNTQCHVSYYTPLSVPLGHHAFPILSVAANVPSFVVDVIYLLSFPEVNKDSTEIKIKV